MPHTSLATERGRQTAKAAEQMAVAHVKAYVCSVPRSSFLKVHVVAI